jgi:hypothetical protein
LIFSHHADNCGSPLKPLVHTEHLAGEATPNATTPTRALIDAETPPKAKLSALWAAVMLCYIYGDIFTFFKPGTLADILAGKTGAFGTQGGLLAAAMLMAIPSVMVFLSLNTSRENKPHRQHYTWNNLYCCNIGNHARRLAILRSARRY